MQVAFLLDENVEKDLGRKLEREGHDVQHVVDVSDLGPGATDDDVRRYAREHDRIIVTYDDHFADPDAASDHAGYSTARTSASRRSSCSASSRR